MQQILLAIEGYLAQVVQFLVHSRLYHPSAVDHEWRVGAYFVLYPVAYGGTQVQLVAYLAKCLVVGCHALLLDAHQGLQGCA